MTSSEVWDADTAAHYDDDCAPMFAPDVLGPTLDRLADLAGGGPALELAVGTGRVAIPLLDRGVPVEGIELSEAMLAQLRRKVDAERLPVTLGDMATADAPGGAGPRFGLAYLVFNTLGNLRTQPEQTACFVNAARHLAPGGRFVVELVVPPIARLAPGQDAVALTSPDSGHLVVDTFDLATQATASHHYYRDDGAPEDVVRYGVGHFRSVWPSECDLMAQIAGMTLESRHADWTGTPFTSAAEKHVSVWRTDRGA